MSSLAVKVIPIAAAAIVFVIVAVLVINSQNCAYTKFGGGVFSFERDDYCGDSSSSNSSSDNSSDSSSDT